MSSRATDVAGLARQLPQALAFGAEHQRQRLPQRRRARDRRRPALSSPTVRKPRSFSSVERAREILHRHQRHQLERAGGRLRQHAGRLRAVPRRGDDRLDRERRGRAQDRADIVRIGDLVEHQHDALAAPGRRDRARAGDRPRPAGPDARHPGRAAGRSRPAARFPASTGSAMPSSARRRAAFSVSEQSCGSCRCGLASAAATVCQP